MTCRCKVCLYYEEYLDHIMELPVEHRDFFMSTYRDMSHLQSKYNGQRDLINGTRPNADEIIKQKREKYALHSSGKQ